jgi:2',3'-cyclic-nucleotide 2'-phosphodiesterase (5'-nucleotidase family)
VAEKAESTAIVQADEYLKYLGALDVTIGENGVVIAQCGKVLGVNTFTADVDIDSIVLRANQMVPESFITI